MIWTQPWTTSKSRITIWRPMFIARFLIMFWTSGSSYQRTSLCPKIPGAPRLQFYRMNIIQEEEFSSYLDADENLSSLYLYPITGLRRRAVDIPLNFDEIYCSRWETPQLFRLGSKFRHSALFMRPFAAKTSKRNFCSTFFWETFLSCSKTQLL